jgi:hypothetical protein
MVPGCLALHRVPKSQLPATAPPPFVVWSQPVMRSQRNNVLAICLIFEAARSPSGAAAGGGSWAGKIDREDT